MVVLGGDLVQRPLHGPTRFHSGYSSRLGHRQAGTARALGCRRPPPIPWLGRADLRDARGARGIEELDEMSGIETASDRATPVAKFPLPGIVLAHFIVSPDVERSPPFYPDV